MNLPAGWREWIELILLVITALLSWRAPQRVESLRKNGKAGL